MAITSAILSTSLPMPRRQVPVTANIGNIRAQPVRGTGEHECRAQPVRGTGEHECRAQTVRDRGSQPIPRLTRTAMARTTVAPAPAASIGLMVSKGRIEWRLFTRLLGLLVTLGAVTE